MKRHFFVALATLALATAPGCTCGATNPGSDAGTGGGAGGGTTGGGVGGGTTGGGGGATGGGGGSIAAARPAKDVISGSGRLTGGNFIMNAQVGQGTPQAPTSGGGRVIQGNTAIKR